MKIKIIIWIVIFVMVIAGLLFVAVKNGYIFPIKSCCTSSLSDKEFLVENYIKENISTLSPVKEVLGGKFYVTKLSFINESSGEVEYEDGHILVKSSFTYYVDKNGMVEISNFKVIE